MIKWIGQHIFDFIARFRDDVYLEDIADGTVASDKFLGLDANNKIVKETVSTTVTDLHDAGVDGAANQLLTDDGDGTVTSESTLTYDAESLAIGADDDGSASIKRSPHSDEAGGDLSIQGGDAGGTDKVGGDLKLYSGASTGAAYGGDIHFYAGGRDVSSGSSNNTPTLQATIDGSASKLLLPQIQTIEGQHANGLNIFSVSGMAFKIDNDNDETGLAFNWATGTTAIMSLLESGNLEVTGSLTVGGFSSAGGIEAINSSGQVALAAQPNITSLGTLTSGLNIGSASYTGDGVTVTGSDSDNTYDVFVGKRKYPRIRLIDDAATGDTEFSIWNLGDELRMGTNPGNTNNAAIVIHTGNAGLVEVQDDLQVDGEIQLGSASDTTIARSAAGKVTIEGNEIITTSTAQTGWHGSATRVKILPRDFHPADGGRPLMFEDDNIGSNQLNLFSNGSDDMFASLPIPSGFKATHVRIYGSDTGQDFYVYSASIENKTIVDVATGSTSIGTEKTLATEVTSSTTNYLIIRVTSDGSTDEVYGGYVTIAAV